MSFNYGVRRALLTTSAIVAPPVYGEPYFVALGEFEPDATTYTVTPGSLPPEHPDRKAIVVVCSHSTGSTSTTGVTAGGAALTAPIADPAGNRDLSFYSGAFATNGTGDFVVTRSNTTNRCGVAVFVFYSSQSAYSARSGAAPNTSSSATSLATTALTIPAGGFAIAAGWVGAVGALSWAQTTGSSTEHVDEPIGTTALQFGVCSTKEAGSQVFTVTTAAAATQMRAGALAWAA